MNAADTRYRFCGQIDLFVRNRISPEDANRQRRTAEAILERLATQPGLILADEVGMARPMLRWQSRFQ